ncbi:hypothetical protein BASA60_000638 [Batrachochytrium salamandrivorans]|nr:hypothetical protein BASA60_000638 [Batrachochytrium salamandrivorans]
MPRKPDGLKALSKFLESDLGEKIAQTIAGLSPVLPVFSSLLESVALVTLQHTVPPNAGNCNLLLVMLQR